MLSIDTLTSKQAQRFKYLESLYNLVGGSPLNRTEHHVVTINAGLTAHSAEAAFHYLLYDGLVEGEYLTGDVSITHKGVKAYESLIPEKDKTHYLGSNVTINNVVNISGEVSESNISIGDQISSSGIDPAKDMVEILGFIKEYLLDVEVDVETETSILSELKTIETQLKSPQPKRQIINTAIKNLKGSVNKSLLDTGVGFLLSRLKELCGSL